MTFVLTKAVITELVAPAFEEETAVRREVAETLLKQHGMGVLRFREEADEEMAVIQLNLAQQGLFKARTKKLESQAMETLTAVTLEEDVSTEPLVREAIQIEEELAFARLVTHAKDTTPLPALPDSDDDDSDPPTPAGAVNPPSV